MQFVHPYFLFGLFAVAVPVIIHLFNFRRYRKIYFTNIRYIKELKQETRRKSRLKHLLVLMTRILAIICLVMVFAQPYIPVEYSQVNMNESKSVSIYLDNSFSMESKADEATLLNLAKQKVEHILHVFDNTDRFHLITNDFEGKHHRFVSKDEFTEYIDDVALSPSVRKLSDVYKRQIDLMNEQKMNNRILFFVSDFQKNISDIASIPADSISKINLVPVQGTVNRNIYIDTCWFDAPVQQIGMKVDLFARIRNVSDISYEKIPAKLVINGIQKGIASFDVGPYDDALVKIAFINHTEGLHTGELQIVDYPVTYDDILYFSYTTTSAIPVLCVYEEQQNQSLNTLFRNDSLFSYRISDVNMLDYSVFTDFQLILLVNLKSISSGLAGELQMFVSRGGSLALFPSDDIEPEDYNNILTQLNSGMLRKKDTLTTRCDYLNTGHPLYNDVFERLPENIDLPTVKSFYPFYYPSSAPVEVLLRLQNDLPFLAAWPYENGKVYLLTSPLDEQSTNFSRHAIFVPTLYKMAILSYPWEKIYYTLPATEEILLKQTFNDGDVAYFIRSSHSDFEMIPEVKSVGYGLSLNPYGLIREAGNYTLSVNDTVIRGLAYNYNREESIVDCLSKEEIQEQIGKNGRIHASIFSSSGEKLVHELEEVTLGKFLWKYFLYFVLLFLLVEILILRFMK